jgi:FMN phosphatase YigB (HAD superfamily)
VKNPPALIFDLGKVLLDFDYTIAARKIVAQCPQPAPNLDQFLGNSDLLAQYESGRITRQAFFETIRDAIGFQGSLTEFSGAFADIFFEIPENIALHAELRRRGYPTYIFSNTNDLAIEHVRRNFPFFATFDGYILSHEVGAVKPQPAIYAALEALTGRRGADLIYLDDRADNIAAGAARGWRTILHTSPERTRQALAAFQVL